MTRRAVPGQHASSLDEYRCVLIDPEDDDAEPLERRLNADNLASVQLVVGQRERGCGRALGHDPQRPEDSDPDVGCGLPSVLNGWHYRLVRAFELPCRLASPIRRSPLRVATMSSPCWVARAVLCSHSDAMSRLDEAAWCPQPHRCAGSADARRHYCVSMSPDEVTAWATIAAVGVAALFGMSGLVVGIIGLVQASRAKKAATAANSLATTANTLATDANSLAGEANTLAETANSLAEGANRVIREQAARETERSDVDWEWKWDEDYPGHVVIKNIGKSQAKDVVVQFFFDSVTEAAGPLDVEGRYDVRLEIPGLKDRRQGALDLAEIDRLGGKAGYAPSGEEMTARVRVRVTWLTPKGSPKIHDTKYYEAPLARQPY